MSDQCPGELNHVAGRSKRPTLRRLRLVPAVVICAVSLTAGGAAFSSVAWGSTPPQAAAAGAAHSPVGGTANPCGTAWN